MSTKPKNANLTGGDAGSVEADRGPEVADSELLELGALATLLPFSDNLARYRPRFRKLAEDTLRRFLGDPADRTLDS